MDKEQLLSLTALEAGQAIKQKKTTSPTLTKAVLEAIEARNSQYNCFINIFAEDAMEQAHSVQKAIDEGVIDSPLAGVPVALKDNLCVKGQLTTCGSKMLENFRPPYSATMVSRLKAAGGVIVGKLNMDEFAMGSTTETSYFGPCKNPWNTEHVSGGSSGGAAAAIAGGMALYTFGSDTGGSVRQPSAFCGVSGLKPTYGKVSRFGLVAYASSLDQIGPLGKDILDCAAALNLVSGQDERDQTSIPSENIDLEAAKNFSLKGLKIGVPQEYFGEGLEPGVKARVEEAITALQEQGALVEWFHMPVVEYAIPTYYIIASAEACSNLARFDGIKYGYRNKEAEDLLDIYFKTRSEGFGFEAKRRIMLGNFVLSSGYYDAYYKKALQAKSLIKDSFSSAFENYDLIIGPTTPTTAPRLGESLVDPLKMYLGDICTALINIAGLPAASIPCGLSDNGLPVGLQLIGGHNQEQTIVGAAAAFQRVTDYHRQRPVTR